MKTQSRDKPVHHLSFQPHLPYLKEAEVLFLDPHKQASVFPLPKKAHFQEEEF